MTSARTLLYIDDQLANRVLVREAMARMSEMTVMAVENGDDGIHAAKVYQPDAILLDLHLKNEDGETVLKRLKEDPATAPIPVFVLSSDESPTRWAKMRELGAAGRIVKDPLLAGLVSNITQAVGASR